MHFLSLVHEEMAWIQHPLAKTHGGSRKVYWRQAREAGSPKYYNSRVCTATTEIILGRTITGTSQTYQTPKNQYEQHVQWVCLGSFHRKKCQSWHHNARILVAHTKELVFGPSNHSASPKIFFPFLSSPRKLPGTFQFWQNGTEHSRPERHNPLLAIWRAKHSTNSKLN